MSVQELMDIYDDNPSQMFKIKVANRSMFKPIWDESRLNEPEELQVFIDEIVKKYPGSRAFVRPSGTEDVLRLYAEGEELAHVDLVANEILTEVDSKYR